MKSSVEQLKKRGKINNVNIDNYKVLTDKELLDKLTSKEAFERTVAIRLLDDRGYFNIDNIQILIDLLIKEKSLYTKLEICKILESKPIIAKLLFNYLGKIGNNQYTRLPNKVSKKISYPLPRDIISRILSNMSVIIILEMFSFLDSANSYCNYEILDAIGFQLFYHPEEATEERFIQIKNCLEKNSKDNLIVWKCITCLSAFKNNIAINYLLLLKDQFTEDIILKEIERSIKIINI